MSNDKDRRNRRYKFPWTRRAEAERAKRVESDEKLEDVLNDWDIIDTSVNAVEREVRINNWTLTAKLLFSGGEKR